MGKPDDIPQDVWDATDKPAFRVALDVVAGQKWDIRPTIARAILAERERCAKVAEATRADETDDDPWSSGWRVACNNIAAAIRKGSD